MNRIWIFAGISVAMHAVMIAELPRLASEYEPPAPPISAQLVTVEAPPAPEPKPAIAPPPRRIAPRPVPVVQPPVRTAAASRPEPAAPLVLPSEPPEPTIEPPVDEPPTEPTAVAETPETPSEAPPGTVAPLPAANAATQPVRDLPQSGSIRYGLFLGSDKMSIGRSVQTWTIDKESYRLTSYAETTGLVGFFRPYQLGYVSEGRIDAAGLKPETFSVRRGRAGARQFAARFDWASGELMLGPVDAPRKTVLPAGTLDMISFIYQLARANLAPGQLHLTITNGNKIDTYTLEVGMEELLELPLGITRAVPVRQVRTAGQESLEIWFAPEQNFLPVRIRFLGRDGRMSGEQVADEIMADDR